MAGYRFKLPLAMALLSAAMPALAVDAEIVAPVLQPGMASLEAMLAASADEFSGEIVDLVDSTLVKPLFMSAFTGAAATLSLIPGLSPRGGGLTVSLGSAASAWSADFSAEGIAALQALRPEDDLEAGLCVQPLLARVSVPLGRVIRGLSADAYLGFMDAQGEAYGVRSFAAGASAGLELFRQARGRKTDDGSGADAGFAEWQGVALTLGGGFSSGTVSLLVEPGAIYQSIPLDPDGSGPLVAQTTTIEVEPSVTAGVRTTVFGARVAAMTGVELFRTFSLSAGGGCGLYTGSSAIELESDDELRVLGYLSELVEENGRVMLSGTTDPETSAGFYPFLAANLGFRVGAFGLSVPVAWSVPKGLALAVLAELRF